MTTTYVFGAGASRDVGYPLASEMGDRLLDFMLKSEDVPETRMEFQPAFGAECALSFNPIVRIPC
jgi:hypothetical protein